MLNQLGARLLQGPVQGSAVAPTRTCSRWVLKLSDEKQPFTPNN